MAKFCSMAIIFAVCIANHCECRIIPLEAEFRFLEPLEKILQDLLPPFIGQKPNNMNGTESWLENYALNDESNEEIGAFSPQELILRAGFAYKNHYVRSGDGYITQLIHVINPLADQNKLKRPPILITHGGIINPSVYVWASNIQHHPEPWPRLPKHGPMTSWNRSLAFMLANNGYDVWLAGTRGSNRQNMGHTKWCVYEPKGSASSHKATPINRTLLELEDTFKYWDFSFDEIIEFELPAQIDRVLELTGAEKLSFMSFSLSTMSALPLFASKPKLAKLIHQHIVMAPIINDKGVNKLIGLLHRVVSKLNYELGVTFFNEFFFTRPVRDLIVSINSDKALRYAITKGASTILLGASAKYHTNLEPGVLGHIFEQLGFRELQHYCQQVIAARLQKYDWGLTKNMLKYGSFEPPAYEIANQHINNWLLIQATNDNFATPSSVQQVYDTIRIKPRKRIVVPSSNHVDLVAAFTNDIYVNLPILAYLNEYQLPPKPAPARSILEQERSASIDLELAKFVPGLHAGDSNGIPDALGETTFCVQEVCSLSDSDHKMCPYACLSKLRVSGACEYN